jgi:hypothetical protein
MTVPGDTCNSGRYGLPSDMYISNFLDKAHLYKFLNRNLHTSHLGTRIVPKPQEYPQNNALEDIILALEQPQLLLAHDIHRLCRIRVIQDLEPHGDFLIVGYTLAVAISDRRLARAAGGIGSIGLRAGGEAGDGWGAVGRGLDEMRAQLIVDQLAEILVDDDVVVAVTDDYPIAVWQNGAGDAEPLFLGNVRNAEAAEVKEYFDVSAGFEFAQEFFINYGYHIAGFVEEDRYA